MDYSLSSSDLRTICPGLKVLTYPELNKYGTLDQVFSGSRGAVAVLYMTGPSYGHWTLLLKHGPGEYEFFDPYAMEPDKELKFINPSFRRESGQMGHLMDLIQDAPGVVRWSWKRMQKESPGINTCGRWVALRALAMNIPLDQFRNMFRSKEASPDQLVVGLSDMFL